MADRITLLRDSALDLDARCFKAPTSDWTKTQVTAYVAAFLDICTADVGERNPTWLEEYADGWIDGLRGAVEAAESGEAYVALLDVTYEVVTPESAEHGEAEETGYHDTGVVVTAETLQELADAVAEEVLDRAGCIDCHNATDRWWQGVDECTDYQTGACTRYAAHLSLGDDDREFLAMVNQVLKGK